MNKITLIGRLTKDPQLQTTNSGIDFCRFNVACKSKMKDEDGEQRVDFFVCVAWRDKASFITKYCKKGTPLFIVGAMGSRKYEKEDGTNSTLWELNVDEIEFAGGKAESGENADKPVKGKSKPKQPEMEPLDDDDEENLPF